MFYRYFILYFGILCIFHNILSAGNKRETPDTIGIPGMQLLEAVEIMAMRESGRLSTLPVSASVIDRDYQIHSIQEVGTMIPNLFVPDYGSRLTSPVYIRGVGSRINAPSVGLYVDDIPYFEKSVYDFDLINIERIEVLRGPQGTLYGRNTMGGLIKVYSPSPFSGQEGIMELTGGSSGFLNTTLSHNFTFSDKTSATFSAGFKRHDGYFENAYTGVNADEHLSSGGRVRLASQVTSSLLLEFVSHYEYLDQGGYPYAVYDMETGSSPGVNYNQPSSYSRHILSNALVANYQLNRTSVRSVTAYQYFSDKQAIDQDFTALDLVFATQEQLQHMVSQELTIRGDNSSDYSWVTGIFGFIQTLGNELDIEFGQDAVNMQLVPVPLSRIQGSDIRTMAMAVFHQSGLDDFLFPGLTLKAGLRLDYEKSELDHVSYMEAEMQMPPPESFASDLSFIKLLPRVGLVYNLSEGSGAFATLTRGYKTGGFNVVFEREEDRSFKPEHSWNYEFGIKGNVFGSRLNYQASLFYIDWKDQQIYQMLPSGQGSMLSNAGSSVSKGFELEAHAIPFANWQVRASYGYTHARFTDNMPDQQTDLSGNFIPYVPRHTLHTDFRYRLETGFERMKEVIFSLAVHGVGRHYWDQENTFYQSWYSRIDGGIDLDFGQFKIDLWARNINSADYHAFSFSALGNYYVQKGRPFTFGLTVRYRI